MPGRREEHRSEPSTGPEALNAPAHPQPHLNSTPADRLSRRTATSDNGSYVRLEPCTTGRGLADRERFGFGLLRGPLGGHHGGIAGIRSSSRAAIAAARRSGSAETTDVPPEADHRHPRARTHEITRQVQQVVERSGVDEGLCHVFIHHTSASLIVCENADPTVRRDLESYAARLAPDGDPSYVHDSEGPDDMSAHIRSILTLTSLTIPVDSGRCDLGTWQGIFLWEHRTSPHRRRITVTVVGDEPAERADRPVRNATTPPAGRCRRRGGTLIIGAEFAGLGDSAARPSWRSSSSSSS